MRGPELMLASVRTDWRTKQRLSVETAIAVLSETGGWWYELKFDGIRAVVRRAEDGTVTIFNRRRLDITYRYQDVVAVIERDHGFVGTLDGEIIVAGEGGRPDFAAAHRRDAQANVARARRLATVMPATFVPFDVLDLDGQDLRSSSYEMRRVHLVRAWGTEGLSVASQDGAAMWAFVLANHLEGLVAKLGSSRYFAGERHASWIKLKSTHRVSALVTSATPGKGSRGPVGALHLALWEPEGKTMVPIGRVGSGMRQEDLVSVVERLASGVPTVVEVEYLHLAASGQLRMPVFKGFRDDIDPTTCTIDTLETQ